MLQHFFHLGRAYFELDHRQAKVHLWLLFFTLLVLCSPLVTYYFYPAPYDEKDLAVLVDSTAFEEDIFSDPLHDESHVALFKKHIDQMKEEDWVSAGLPVYVAKRIMKYQSKVKRLKKVNDLYTIYGIDSSHVMKLRPYLEDAIASQSTVEEKYKGEKFNRKKQQRVFAVLDINTVDSMALEALPTIGPVLSKRILKYRELLKGYVRKEQYAEIYGISPEALVVLKQQTEIKTIPFVCLLPAADYLRLSAHFYLSGKDAKFILSQLKINQGTCWEELKNGLEYKAQEHVEELKLYYPCK